jgi:hypothetical protein
MLPQLAYFKEALFFPCEETFVMQRPSFTGRYAPLLWIACCAVVLITVQTTVAETYSRVMLDDLDIAAPFNMNRWQVHIVELEDEGTAFIRWYDIQTEETEEVEGNSIEEIPNELNRSGYILVARVPEARDLKCGCDYFTNDQSELLGRLEFTARKRKMTTNDTFARTAYYQAQRDYYRNLGRGSYVGGAWFRHKMREAEVELGINEDEAFDENRVFSDFEIQNEFGDSFHLFTGGRAVAENLQLDAVLRIEQDKRRTVNVDTIRGVNVAEIDWEPLIDGLNPEKDVLAPRIPFDQHAFFLPSFNSLIQLTDEVRTNGIPVVGMRNSSPRNTMVLERYQKQLQLPLDDLARALGGYIAKSVAITGSDPYFPTGTDIATLFETESPAMLHGILVLKVQSSVAADPTLADRVEWKMGEIDGCSYAMAATPSRDVSCCIATIDGVVVASNSLAQVERLIETARDEYESIEETPEYTFFRDRYPLGVENETGFLLLTDATIRRWCSPEYRIRASRRLRQAAVIAEVQASQLEAYVRGDYELGPIHTDLPLTDGSSLTLTENGVQSSVYGTLEFLTPIVELPIKKVTVSEQRAYEQWRNRYEGIWRAAFDPIGLQLTVTEDRIETDLTVMPLSRNSRYDDFVDIVAGGSVDPYEGDPHDSLAHFVIALDLDSPRMRSGIDMLESMGQGLSLSWIGDYATVYVDRDPIWAEFQEYMLESDKDFDSALFDFFIDEGRMAELPLAVGIETSSPFGMAIFLTAFRSYIEQTAPDLTIWESHRYKDAGYVEISAAPNSDIEDELGDVSIYYVTSGKLLLISLSESVIHGVIDRKLARASGEEVEGDDTGETLATAEELEEVDPLEAARPWLGSSMGLQLDGDIFQIAVPTYQEGVKWMYTRSGPILREYETLFPEENPAELHERVWGERLALPPEILEMDDPSPTVLAEYDETQIPVLFKSWKQADFGITFENGGIRARVVIER